MRRSNLSTVLYVVVIFISGLLVGALGHRYVSGSVCASAPRAQDDYRRQYMSEMQARLKLDAAQMEQLDTILDSIRDEYRAFRQKYKPELQAIQDSQVRQINAILSSDQRSEYDHMREERERRRAQLQHQKK